MRALRPLTAACILLLFGVALGALAFTSVADERKCPAPSARSVEALFAPCLLAAEAPGTTATMPTITFGPGPSPVLFVTRDGRIMRGDRPIEELDRDELLEVVRQLVATIRRR